MISLSLRPRALVVEAGPVLGAEIAGALARDAFVVTTAATVAAAARLLRVTPLDCLVIGDRFHDGSPLDVMMQVVRAGSLAPSVIVAERVGAKMAFELGKAGAFSIVPPSDGVAAIAQTLRRAVLAVELDALGRKLGRDLELPVLTAARRFDESTRRRAVAEYLARHPELPGAPR